MIVRVRVWPSDWTASMSLFISIAFSTAANDNQFPIDCCRNRTTARHGGVSVDTAYACCCVRLPTPHPHPRFPNLPPRITRQICKNTLLISRQKWQPPPMTSALHTHPSCPPPHFHFHFSFPAVHLRPNTLSQSSPTYFPPVHVTTRTQHTVHCIWTARYTRDNIIPCPLCSV